MASFPPQFVETLRLGKYTDWATREFSGEHLKCLLWMIGEFDASASTLLDFFIAHGAELRGAKRPYLALEAMHHMVRGERFGVDEWRRRFARDRAHLQISDVPEAVRLALQAAAPGATWQIVMMIPEGYEISGKDAAGQPVHAYVTPQGTVNELSATRRRGKLALSAVVSSELAQDLMGSKFTHWAVARELSEDCLLCLLWLVGEVSARGQPILELLNRCKAELADHQRARIALHAMGLMCRGERFDADELLRRMERGRAQLEVDDVPEALLAAARKAVPRVTWTFAWMTPRGYLLGGSGPAGEPSVEVTHRGKVLVKRRVSEQDLPPPVIAAIRERAPGTILFVRSVGPALSIISSYEVLVEPPVGRNQKLMVAADGRDVTIQA